MRTEEPVKRRRFGGTSPGREPGSAAAARRSAAACRWGCGCRRGAAWLVVLASLSLGPAAAEEMRDRPSGRADVVGHHDVVYLSPPRQGWEGWPLGNGRLGAQVWQPDGLVLQLNTPLSGVYGGSICRLHLRSNPDLLAGLREYKARLELYDATLNIDITTVTGTVSITCMIFSYPDLLVVSVDDRRKAAGEWTAELETWRPSASITRSGMGWPCVTDTLKYQGEPDYHFAAALSLSAKVRVAESDPGRILLRTGEPRFHLFLGFAASHAPDYAEQVRLDPRLDVTRRAQELASSETRLTEHRLWWGEFWGRSFVSLSSDDGVADYLANLWYLHLYAMAAGSQGEVPPKFNGGLWTHERDEREWGGAYWHWNTQETYWPLYAANQLELVKPYYDMYADMLPAVRKWTQATWGLDGAQFQETMPFNGAMQVWESERGVHPRLPTPKHVAHTNLILSSSAEIAMQFWWYWLYTGDEQFLRERAYPLMKEVAAFYVGYLNKDGTGRYGMFPSNAHETFWKVRNPATDLAALRYFLPSVIAASTKLAVDAELRAVWQDRLEHLAPFSLNAKTGAILPYEVRPGETAATNNAENPEIFGVGVFPLQTLGTPEFDLGLRTFRARTNVGVYGWTTDSIAAARLGLADAAPKDAPPQHMNLEQLLPLHVEYHQNYPCGLQDYYSRKPGKHVYLEGSGTLATAVNEMLLQSWHGVLRICPALPHRWNADFTLLAMGGFEVTAHAEKGVVQWVSIRSQRGEPLALVNPFVDGALVREGQLSSGLPELRPGPLALAGARELMMSKDSIVRLPTQAGRVYQIAPVGAPPPQELPRQPLNQAPKHLSPTSRRWLGKTAPGSAAWKPPVELDAPAPPAVPATVERSPKPEIQATRLATPPTDDPQTDAAASSQAPALGPFLRLAKSTPATQPTEVRIGYDDTALYLSVTCWEDRMAGLLAEFADPRENHDSAIFMDDAVEFFLQPGAAGPVWHLAVNPFGVRYDARGLSAETDDKALNPAWEAKTALWSNRWLVQARIPFTALVPYPPQAGEVWGFNVCRSEKPHGELSTFAPLRQARFHQAADFARLQFVKGVATAFPPVAADPDLIGRWTFDDHTKSSWVFDVSGHRHDGLLTAPLPRAASRPGCGSALVFDGTGYVDIAAVPDLNLGDAFTIALWLQPMRGGAMRLVDKTPVGGSDGYLIDTHPDGNLRVITRRAGLAASQVKLPVNKWSHVAVALGNGKLTAYVDGKPVAETATRAALTATDLPLRFGASSQGWDRFFGLMDDVRLYRRALAPDEIRALMAAP